MGLYKSQSLLYQSSNLHSIELLRTWNQDTRIKMRLYQLPRLRTNSTRGPPSCYPLGKLLNPHFFNLLNCVQSGYLPNMHATVLHASQGAVRLTKTSFYLSVSNLMINPKFFHNAEAASSQLASLGNSSLPNFLFHNMYKGILEYLPRVSSNSYRSILC